MGGGRRSYLATLSLSILTFPPNTEYSINEPPLCSRLCALLEVINLEPDAAARMIRLRFTNNLEAINSKSNLLQQTRFCSQLRIKKIGGRQRLYIYRLLKDDIYLFYLDSKNQVILYNFVRCVQCCRAKTRPR